MRAVQCREDQVEQESRPWFHSSSKATSFVLPMTRHSSRCRFQTLVVFHSGVFCPWSYLRSLSTIELLRLARTYYISMLFSMSAIQQNLSWRLKRRSLCSVLAPRWKFRKFCRCLLFSWLDAALRFFQWLSVLEVTGISVQRKAERKLKYLAKKRRH